TLLAFLESAYVAAADLGRWDRPALEWPSGTPAAPARCAFRATARGSRIDGSAVVRIRSDVWHDCLALPCARAPRQPACRGSASALRYRMTRLVSEARWRSITPYSQSLLAAAYARASGAASGRMLR